MMSLTILGLRLIDRDAYVNIITVCLLNGKTRLLPEFRSIAENKYVCLFVIWIHHTYLEIYMANIINSDMI